MDKGIWSICPEYFRDNQEELKKDRNPLYKFLVENSVYDQSSSVSGYEAKVLFEEYLGKPIRKLDYGTFIQVDERYTITYNKKICKHCKKEADRGCCENYNHKDRTCTNIINNIRITL